MNAINIRSGLVCLLVAGFATSHALAMDGAAAEQHRAEKQQRQEQHQGQNNGHGHQYANNPPPPRQGPPVQVPTHQDPPAQVPPRHGPPAQVPPRQGPPAQVPPRQGPPAQVPPRHGPPAQVPPPAAPGGQHSPGNSGNNHVIYGPPRGPQGPNYHGPGSNIVPPPRYVNQPGRGYPYVPGHGNPPGYGHSPGYGHAPYYAYPRYVSSLPAGYRHYYWNGNPYYYQGGYWYRPHGSSYVVVGAPYGLFVSSLPYYSSFWFGSTRYYYSDGVYYNYEPARSGYVVTPSPYADEQQDDVSATADDMYIYPAQGQSQQQQADDKYECHRWAVDQSQYDPSSSDFDAQRRADYDRAMTACLTGRGYTVR